MIITILISVKMVSNEKLSSFNQFVDFLSRISFPFFSLQNLINEFNIYQLHTISPFTFWSENFQTLIIKLLETESEKRMEENKSV